MTYDGYSTLKVDVTDRVARVTIDHAPINNLDAALASDLISFVREVAHDELVAVIILESANEEFFVAHADMEFMFDAGPLMALADPDGEEGLNPLQQFHERFRALPQVTIAKLQGFARAGGVELAMAADLRFAAAGKTWLAQPETRMGIFPGGGGTQYLTRLVGRARALEIVLGAGLYGTDLAEKYGWINRAIQPDELDDFVTSLARRIANLPAGVAAAAMEAIDAAEASGAVPVLAEESAAHVKVYPSPESVVEKIRRAVDAGAQTAEGERDLEGLLDSVN
jgi:enoyl-CoA hydratase/carnithine racemase